MLIAKALPQNRYEQVLFLFFVVLTIGTCIAPPYPDYLLMQHAPSFLGALVLPYVSSRFALSRLSFTLIVVFLCLHSFGARYLYSYVPYDKWSAAWFGFGVSQTFGFERNHFDRLVHFSYGLLFALPIQEVERRYLHLSAIVASVLAIECVLATSAAFELIEWFVAVVHSPDWAEAFLGHQGDPFDAQKDMALATAGAIVSVGAMALIDRRRKGYLVENSTAAKQR